MPKPDQPTMKFTKQQLLDLDPCADGLAFARLHKFDFVKIYNECERGDWLIWWLRRSGNMDKTQAVKVAIACAEHVLELFEKKYPDDKRPRQAIEAAIEWVKNPTEENRKKCRTAAAYAYAAAAYAYAAAAYAASAADAYAAAADAYAAAASSAADASSAAADAYTAAAYAASAAAASASADARKNERKWQANKIREIIPCPFE
jgi:hypothetical protein